MILENKKATDNFAITEKFEDVSTVTAKGMHKLAYIAEDLYRNEYIFIQELASNSWDANLENGKADSPIVVKLVKNEDDYTLSFIDNGVGMDEERIRIFNSLGESTSDTKVDSIGGYGIGSRSVYKFVKSFTINTTYQKDGKFYECLYLARSFGVIEKVVNLLSKKEVKPTETGTEIKVSVDHTRVKKVIEFCKKQLLYFDNLVFEGELQYLNKFVIEYNKNFIFNVVTNEDMLFRVGQVPYRIDWKLIEMDKINLPILVNLHPNKARCLPTREDVAYDDEAMKQYYRDSIQKAVDEFHDICIEKMKDYKTIDLIKILYKSPVLKTENGSIELVYIIDKNTLISSIIKDNYPNLSKHIGEGYISTFDFYSLLNKSLFIDNAMGTRRSRLYDVLYDVLYFGTYSLYYKESINSNYLKTSYLRSKPKSFIVTKVRLYLIDYIINLHLKKIDKQLWRGLILEVQKLVNNIILENTTPYMFIRVDKSKLTTDSVIRKKISKTHIPAKEYTLYGTYKYELNTFKKFKERVYYVHSSKDIRKNPKLFSLMLFLDIPVLIIHSTHKKKIKQISNLYYYTEFEKLESKTLDDKMWMFRIYKIIKDFHLEKYTYYKYGLNKISIDFIEKDHPNIIRLLRHFKTTFKYVNKDPFENLVRMPIIQSRIECISKKEEDTILRYLEVVGKLKNFDLFKYINTPYYESEVYLELIKLIKNHIKNESIFSRKQNVCDFKE